MNVNLTFVQFMYNRLQGEMSRYLENYNTYERLPGNVSVEEYYFRMEDKSTVSSAAIVDAIRLRANSLDSLKCYFLILTHLQTSFPDEIDEVEISDWLAFQEERIMNAAVLKEVLSDVSWQTSVQRYSDVISLTPLLSDKTVTWKTVLLPPEAHEKWDRLLDESVENVVPAVGKHTTSKLANAEVRSVRELLALYSGFASRPIPFADFCFFLRHRMGIHIKAYFRVALFTHILSKVDKRGTAHSTPVGTQKKED